MASIEHGRSRPAGDALDALPARAAILDETGTVVETNRAWRTDGPGRNATSGSARNASGDSARNATDTPATEGADYPAVCAERSDALGERAAAGVRDVLAGRRDEFVSEYAVPGPDGKRWFSMRVVPVEHGEEPHAMVVHLDITRRKRAERRVADRNEQLEALTRVLATDVEEDVEAAREAIAARALREDDFAPELQDAQAALERVTDLLDDALVLTRDAEVSPRDPVDVGALAERVWADLDTPDARLAVDDPPTVDADEEQLAQLLERLLENAVEHGTTGGETLTVRVEAAADGFAVADDGAGIDPERREHVFDAGYTTGRFNAGLGLAIVDQLARAHGWDVSLDASAAGTRVECTGLSRPSPERDANG